MNLLFAIVTIVISSLVLNGTMDLILDANGTGQGNITFGQQEEQQKEFENYTNEDYGISIEYPED